MTNPNLENPRQEWTTFTYIGKETTYITDIYIYIYMYIYFKKPKHVADKCLN